LNEESRLLTAFDHFRNTLARLLESVSVYTAASGISTYSNTTPANYVPGWFGNVIAVTLAILGIVLIILGAGELGFHYFDRCN